MSFFRKFKFEDSIGNYLESHNKIDEIIEEKEDFRDDVFLRSSKYSLLKKIYDEYFEGKI